MAADDGVAALRATAHPLRLQMLSLLTGTSMSAAELARELGATQANASYHLRVLAEAGEVVPDGMEVVRGGVAKKFRHPWRPADRPDEREGTDQHLIGALATELTRRHALRDTDSKQVLCDAEMWVSDAVWSEVMAHVVAASELMHDRAQRPRTNGTRHRNLQLVAFEMRDR